MKLYVASSWRNEFQPGVVAALRHAGHDVYDFRNPAPGNHGFHWSDIDVNWRSWDPNAYTVALMHPIAEAGFRADFEAMQRAEGCVLVLPSGRSAHLEAGWFAGAGRPVWILQTQPEEPELMAKLCLGVCTNMCGMLLSIDNYVHGTPATAFCPATDSEVRATSPGGVA